MERKKKLILLSALMDFDSLDESSEDSDFRIEDHADDESHDDVSDEDVSTNSEDEQSKSDNSCDKIYTMKTCDVKETNGNFPIKNQNCKNIELSRILICCICLGDKSNDHNEIVECDNCGVTVHEDCYGIPENESISSSGSGCSKTAWFCDTCQAGKENPTCELCPNSGGVYKETDTGMWVHLVCALYIPGVAFRDVDKLSHVTLFEMSYNKWGERACSLCHDQQFARTGVCIGCDAGLCRTYFHVTCAQKEGLLSEAQSEEINHADPFYAHCKLHTDKNVSKEKKCNWLALELQMRRFQKQYTTEGCNNKSKDILLKDKLSFLNKKYAESKVYKGKPWIPTQKMSRPLTSSSSTLRALNRKASLSGIDMQALAMKEAHTNALADVHRKWHISPAFNVEYMGYYLDRNYRINSLKQNLELLMDENSKLVKEQRELQMLCSQAMKDYKTEVVLSEKLKKTISTFTETLSWINLTNKLPKIYQASLDYHLTSKQDVMNSNAVKIDCSVMNNNKELIEIPESLCLKCVTCGMVTDQHLLVKCDICHLYYHLNCLDPPLMRMPKKTKVMGWQCSECDKSSSDSDVAVVDTDKPRQLREFRSSWANYGSFFKASTGNPKKKRRMIESKKEDNTTFGFSFNEGTDIKQTYNKQLNKKEERKNHQTNSTGSDDSNSQNIKRKCLNVQIQTSEVGPSLTIEAPMEEINSRPDLQTIDNPSTSIQTIIEENTSLYPGIVCVTCKKSGTRANIVTCDECLKGFHFQCLNPPVKKSPKVRGYSWHCADCDPSESGSDI